MKNCSVCSNLAQKAISYCQNCGWPLAFADEDFRDPNLKQAVISWAYQKYREGEVLKLGRVPTNAPSNMNVQMPEPTQTMEPLQMEITTLNNGMKVIVAEQDEHAKKIQSLFDRLQALEQLFQAEKKNNANFVDQQSAENRQLYSQQKSLFEISNQHTRVLNNINSARVAPGQQPVGSQFIAINDALDQPPLSIAAHSEQDMLSAEGSIVTEYNKVPNEIPGTWREHATNVSIDPEAFARLRDGDDSNITFNKDRKGNYLILPRGGRFYLVPNKQRKIISQIYITTKAIYDCDGYNESYRDFQLIKPALIAEESIDCWRLSQKGTLQFI
jgi:hypothetical protein